MKTTAHILAKIVREYIFERTSFTDILTSVCDEKLAQIGDEHKVFMTNAFYYQFLVWNELQTRKEMKLLKIDLELKH